MTIVHALVLALAACVGGMLNSIAGGGTLVSFPALLWYGIAPIEANATNALALWPGSLSSAWGYRAEVGSGSRRYLVLIVPSLVGALLGAMLLRRTPAPVFARLVPFLVLFATLLFAMQNPLQRWLRRHPWRSRRGASSAATSDNALVGGLAGAVCFQFAAATYGGYFGAGMGIVMLANLALIGLTDIHQMNGLKNVFGFVINFVAAMYFVHARLVHWPEALVMMAGALVGGYASAGVARRLGREFARRAVVVIGLVFTIALLVRRSVVP
jgi:uncharacterized membrane protein YfcA